MLGAGDRMPGNEMDAGGNVRRHFAHHRGFDRPDVRYDGACSQMWADFPRHDAADTHRDADDHEIGARRRSGVRPDDLIGEAEFADAPPRRFGSRGRDNRFDDAERPRRPGDRRADKADADQRQPIEQRCGLGHSITPLLSGIL